MPRVQHFMRVKIESLFQEWAPYGTNPCEVYIWEWVGWSIFGKKGKLLCAKNFKNELDAGEFILKMKAYYDHFTYD